MAEAGKWPATRASMIDNSANHIKRDNRLPIKKINVPLFCLYFVIMQIHNRHEGTTRGREQKHFEQRFYIEHERKINGATAIGKGDCKCNANCME